MARFYGPQQYPSITTTFEIYDRFKGINPDMLARKAKLGKEVHKYTALMDKGFTWFPQMPKKIIPYLDQWEICVEENIEEFIWIEKPKISEIWKYGGTPDRLGVIKGKRFPGVVQLKTSATIDRFILMQVAAEMALAKENYKKKILDQGYVVRLFPDHYKFDPLYETPKDYADAFQGFHYNLWLYHYLNGRRS